MRAYKVELLILDNEGLGKKEIINILEDTRCLYPSVMGIQSKNIGEWDDDHPLNKTKTAKDEFKKLFG